ncbi:hypothetical protein E5F05_17170 [Deinococcus metallilatus]|uniref:Uncharacterized protein n=1 Tax=Deinococcus metallilatus TaxID=1211322 RepID=A0AAJ5F5G6_9DEIO|nr:hypothetical protein [Deinococcus metallilatus]MBB5294756.1 hypothetical protein [Deinococcus metallilatus]QBY09516.1 hypothetical protein E5F05_17170 [Deinococcus metallilatus]RXJ09521.1 hypothetical protein ERJ73_16010 [Deinococcus metallilatus]TLK29043.1 hypothetical protein FCS05_07775 [Deinococcus metallilatus]GMA16682.1 hypothetical protein GCM10025871_30130 [Deinococcus metallilatus]
MASGLSNKLTGQIGEFLVCAELGRQLDLVATPFAGNVPAFDLLVADEQCRSIPIQVKAARGLQWPSRADNWINLEVVGDRQVDHGDRILDHPGLIYVYVAIAPKHEAQAQTEARRDRFFILTQQDVQSIMAPAYRAYMEDRKTPWQRPRNPASFDARLDAQQLKKFENNWNLIRQQLEAQNPPTPPLPLPPSL